jgi:hypothetical protein
VEGGSGNNSFHLTTPTNAGKEHAVKINLRRGAPNIDVVIFGTRKNLSWTEGQPSL